MQDEVGGKDAGGELLVALSLFTHDQPMSATEPWMLDPQCRRWPCVADAPRNHQWQMGAWAEKACTRMPPSHRCMA
jgi:hypothetical protein